MHRPTRKDTRGKQLHRLKRAYTLSERDLATHRHRSGLEEVLQSVIAVLLLRFKIVPARSVKHRGAKGGTHSQHRSNVATTTHGATSLALNSIFRHTGAQCPRRTLDRKRAPDDGCTCHYARGSAARTTTQLVGHMGLARHRSWALEGQNIVK